MKEHKGNAAAEFSREAGQVMNSPYFYEHAGADDGVDKIIAFNARRDAEAWTLRDVLADCEKYEDLQGEPRRIYDAAKASIKSHSDFEETWGTRIFGEDIGGSAQWAPEVAERMPLTAEESQLLGEAITQAMESGDKQTADKLASLAKSPQKVRKILAGANGKRGQKHLKIKPSSFQRRR